MHECAIVLDDGVVVDNDQVMSMTIEEREKAFPEIYSQGVPVYFVQSHPSFFTGRNLLTLLRVGDNRYHMVAQRLGLLISDHDVEVLRDYNRVVNLIKTAVDAMKPDYPFVDVPGDFDVQKNFTINKASIRRLTFNGDQYSVSTASALKAWDAARKFWRDGKEGTRSVIVNNAGYGNRTAIIYPASVIIGCQSIPRFEIEQLALSLGWPFQD